MTRPNVHLVTDEIKCFLSNGIKTVTGEEIQVDVIILATGFDIDAAIRQYDSVGRDGKSREDHWQDSPSAYLGVATKGNLRYFFGLANVKIMSIRRFSKHVLLSWPRYSSWS